MVSRKEISHCWKVLLNVSDLEVLHVYVCVCHF